MDNRILLHLAKEAMGAPIYPNPLFPPSPYYRFLRLLAEHIQPVVSVELGVCGGGGCLHLALGWPQGRVIGVDYQDHVRFPERFAHIESVCNNIDFWTLDSIEAAGYAKELSLLSGELVDILFIDTVHTYERTVAEFDAWRPLLSPRAVVLIDDLFRGGMLDAWNDLPGNKLRLDFLHTGSTSGGGFGAIWGIR